MSMTNAQKQKQKKRKARERSIAKKRNIAHGAAPKFRLDVYQKGQWVIGAKRFSNAVNVGKYCDTVEQQRAQGMNILYGRIVDLTFGRMICEIKASSPADEPVTASVREPEKPRVDVVVDSEAKGLTLAGMQEAVKSIPDSENVSRVSDSPAL